MIRLDQISKQHGPQILFVDASAALFRGEKIGPRPEGPNGAGKSTIFRMIMREETPDDGQVSVEKNISIGYFSQDVGEMKGLPVVAEVMAGAGAVSEVAAEMKTLEEALADTARADEMDKIPGPCFGEVQARFDELGGYALEARAREILDGLGFSQEVMDGDVLATCRAAGRDACVSPPARILLMRPDAMLRSTGAARTISRISNPLIWWLEGFLKVTYEGALLK